MTHSLAYFAAKAKKLNDALDSKRDEGLKLDRELCEINDQIDAIKAEIGALNTEAAEAGHLIADVHAAADAIEDEQGIDGLPVEAGDKVLVGGEPRVVRSVSKPKKRVGK